MFQKFPVSEVFPVIFKDVSEVSSLSDVSSDLLDCSRSSFVSWVIFQDVPRVLSLSNVQVISMV
jgi:hypothetical protein